LRPPLDLISPWGMGIASGTELRHFLNAMRNWRSFAYVTRRVVWHMLDLVVHRRGMKHVNGNAPSRGSPDRRSTAASTCAYRRQCANC